MAEILNGEGGHTSFAPLSQSQTLQICQHLHDLIRQLQVQADTVIRPAVQRNDEAIATLREGLSNANAGVHSLQEGLSHADTVVDGLRKEQARINTSVSKTTAGMDDNRENIESIIEAQQLTNGQVSKVASDLERNIAQTKEVQHEVEHRIGHNFEKLQDRVGRLELKLDQLTEYDEIDKITAQEQKEALRRTDTSAQLLRDDLTKTNTVIHMMEARLQERGKGMQDTQQHLDQTNAVILKLHEDQQHSKAAFEELRQGCKKMNAHVGQVHGVLDNAIKALTQLESRVDDAAVTLDSTRIGVEQAKSNVQGLKETQAVAQASLQNLAQNLAETSCATQQVKAGLKETQAIVLPNLQMDHAHGNPLASGGIAGGATMAIVQQIVGTGSLSARGRPFSKGDHIKKVTREINQSSTNPNRMAWI